MPKGREWSAGVLFVYENLSKFAVLPQSCSVKQQAMKRMFYLLTALFALLFVSSSSAYPTRRTDRAIKQVLQEFQAVGISAAVVKDGKIVYNKSFGVKDLESKAPLRNEHLMRIASISKSFTATALMQLVEQGKLTLESDVSERAGHPGRPRRRVPFRLRCRPGAAGDRGLHRGRGVLHRILPAHPRRGRQCAAGAIPAKSRF